MRKLNEKVAVVTGGNSGIGYAIAQAFKTEGAKVIITGRSAEKVKVAAQELGVESIVADAIDLSAITGAAKEVKAKQGKIDILVVNAGIYTTEPVGQITEAVFDQQMGINFKGAVFTIEQFLPLLNNGGSIVNISSILAYAGMPNNAIYSASKAALNAYTRTAASELATRKIRINAINPGPVATPIFGKTGMPEEVLNGFAQAMQERIPLKRLGQPEDIAEMAVFLASEAASFITGGEYNVDGGMNVHPLLFT